MKYRIFSKIPILLDKYLGLCYNALVMNKNETLKRMVFVAGQAEDKGSYSYHGKESALIDRLPKPLSSTGRYKKSTLCPMVHTMSPHPKKQIKTNPLKKWTARASGNKTKYIPGHTGTITREVWMAIVRKRNICPRTGKAAANYQPIPGLNGG
jgi:hypothetical protein